MKALRIIPMLLLFAGLAADAQQLTLEGEVFLHNSRHLTGRLEPVEGVMVSAPFTVTQVSNRKGKFNLEFAEVDRGQAITISVEKAGLEAVNLRSLQGVAIGREAPLRIFMAEKGWLEEERRKLLDISLQALDARCAALASVLEAGGAGSQAAMVELQEQLNRGMNNRFEAGQVVADQREELKQLLPEMAESLARVNLDFAAPYYRQAFELYRRGGMAEVIAALNDGLLKQEGEQALSAIREYNGKGKEKQAAEAREHLLQVADGYQLKAQAHLLLLHYRSALDASRGAARLLEKAGEPANARLAAAYSTVALNGLLAGAYEEALDYQQKNIGIREALLGGDAPEVASAFSRLAAIYEEMEEYPMALEAQQKAAEIRERALPPGHPDIAASYAGLAAIYHVMGEYKKGLYTQRQAIRIQEEALPPNHPDVAHAYHYLAQILMDEGAHLKALEAQLKALFIQERALPLGHPDAIDSYSTLSLVYLNLGDYEKAMEVQKKIIALQERSRPAGHPDIGTSCHNLASTFYFMGELDSALHYEHRAYRLFQGQLPAGHPHLETVESSFAFLYSTRGERHQAAGELDAAIRDLQQALQFRPDSEDTKRRIRQIEAARELGATRNQDVLAFSPKGGGGEPRPAPAKKDTGFFRVTKATSLRAGPSSSTKVLRRLRPGDRLKVLEKTEKYWWKVDDEGRVGYVKALLLEQ